MAGKKKLVVIGNGMTAARTVEEILSCVFASSTHDDCDHIAAYAKKSRRAARIGGGLLGVEAARGLLNYGCEVHIIDIGAYLMGQQLDAQAGAILKPIMEELTIHVHLQK